MSTTPPTTEQPPSEPQEPARTKYMTILEHLTELRYRLIVAGAALVVTTGVSFAFAKQILEFLKEPAEDRSSTFVLIFTEPMEGLVAFFRVALLAGLIGAMPMIVFQLLMFVTPALTRQEKRWVYGVVFGASLAFAAGVAFAYYVALPPALGFLLNFPEDVAKPQIKIGSYVDFVTRLLFWTGVVFETPLLIMGLARFRVVNARQLVRMWRYAFIGAFVVSAIVTPSVDPITQSLVAGPIIVLYAIGILLAWLVQPRQAPTNHVTRTT
jgi:sec-independent protein translocase protein TatC